MIVTGAPATSTSSGPTTPVEIAIEASPVCPFAEVTSLTRKQNDLLLQRQQRTTTKPWAGPISASPPEHHASCFRPPKIAFAIQWCSDAGGEDAASEKAFTQTKHGLAFRTELTLVENAKHVTTTRHSADRSGSDPVGPRDKPCTRGLVKTKRPRVAFCRCRYGDVLKSDDAHDAIKIRTARHGRTTIQWK